MFFLYLCGGIWFSYLSFYCKIHWLIFFFFRCRTIIHYWVESHLYIIFINSLIKNLLHLCINLSFENFMYNYYIYMIFTLLPAPWLFLHTHNFSQFCDFTWLLLLHIYVLIFKLKIDLHNISLWYEVWKIYALEILISFSRFI